MDVPGLIATILKKVLPNLVGAAISMIVANWALQAVSVVPVLMWIIKIAVTIFIVLYLTIILWDAFLEKKDRHHLREVQISLLKSGSSNSWVVDANPAPFLIGSPNKNNMSSHPPNHILKKFFLIICIIVLILAIIISAIFFYFHLTNPPIHGPSIIDPTATAIAANPYPPYFHGRGSLALSDPLIQPSRLWQTSPHCQFIKQAYYVSTSHTNNTNTCSSLINHYKNFTYEVEMTILKGDCGGLLFRQQNTSSKYYFFQICQDRTYALLKYVDNSSLDAQVFFGKTEDNSAIVPGLGQMNRIAVITKGSSIYLYISNHQVAEITDHSYADGFIGFVAYSYQKTSVTEVAYQNARLWEDTTT